MRQHSRQILYFKLHVNSHKFDYRRPHAAVWPQVVHCWSWPSHSLRWYSIVICSTSLKMSETLLCYVLAFVANCLLYVHITNDEVCSISFTQGLFCHQEWSRDKEDMFG